MAGRSIRSKNNGDEWEAFHRKARRRAFRQRLNCWVLGKLSLAHIFLTTYLDGGGSGVCEHNRLAGRDRLDRAGAEALYISAYERHPDGAGVRQRATGTPRTQYQAEIELTDREYQILTEITVSYVRARVPGATDPVVVTFVRSEDGSPNPFTVSQRMIVQGPSSYTVRIDLARAPAAVQYAG